VSSDEDDGYILCATYTHARRHPMVLGHIGGWTPPFQLSVTQIGVLLVILWFEMQTWRWWGTHLPRTVGVVVAIAVPCLLAWVVRKARFEGRSLPRAALGWLSFLSAAPTGRVGGRPYRPPRAAALDRAEVFVAAGGRRDGMTP
jgi:hypothetical protein